MTAQHIKWPSVERFSDIVYRCEKHGVRHVSFRPKVKLHGTNAGIQVTPENELIAQGRKRLLYPAESDNYAFAQFVSTLKAKEDERSQIYIIFGEWAGKGIQQKDAVTKLDDKYLFVYAIQMGLTPEEPEKTLVVDPDRIAAMLDTLLEDEGRERIKIIPWYNDVLDFDLQDQQNTEIVFQNIQTSWVDKDIGVQDPFIKDEFDIDGPGEGLVFFPQAALELYWPDYLWKVKTASHNENLKKQRVHVKKPEGVDEFIAEWFTENRMNKIYNEEFNDVERVDRSQTGNILKAIMQDVHKESKQDIEKADFEWKHVAKDAPKIIKFWFFDKINSIDT